MFKWLLDWGEEVKNRFQAVVPGYFGGAFITSPLVEDIAAGLVILDTQQLPAGIYDIRIGIFMSGNLSLNALEFQHRDASNDVSLAAMSYAVSLTVHAEQALTLTRVKEGERFRFVGIGTSTTDISCWISYCRRFPLKRGQ